eukprot:gene25366-33109_t
MGRHDCLWNSSEPGALADVIINTSNEEDQVTTSQEEFDYSLIGMDVQPEPTSHWIDNGADASVIQDVSDSESDDESEEDETSKEKYPKIHYTPKRKRATHRPEPKSPVDTRPKRVKTPTTKFQQYQKERADRDLRTLHSKFDKMEQSASHLSGDTGYTDKSSSATSKVTPDEDDDSDTESESAEIPPSHPDYLPYEEMPKKMKEALCGKERAHWRKAWEYEIWNLSSKPIKSKFVFRKTIRPDGSIKYRVRLVACGYSQILGKDYDETYAPTAKYRSLCIILNLAAIFNWDIEGIDVEQAFLESPLDKEIYMTLPKDVYCQRGFPDKPILVKLLRSLYGLKQAGELWYKTVKEILTDFKYVCLIHDACVFIKRNPDTGKVVIVVVYVDDILFIGDDKAEIQEILTHVESRVTAMTTMGEVTRYIGVEIKRDRVNHTLSLSQQPFIDKIVKNNDGGEKSAIPIPMQPQADYNTPGDGSNPPIQKQVGEFRFLADRTRPDIQAAVGILGSSAVKPNKAHLKGVDHLARYIKGSRDMLLTFGGSDDSKVELFCYTDTAHLQDTTSKPRMGYAFFLNLESGTVYAKSVKSNTVSHSSCEAEAKAIDAAAIQTIWLRGFLAELGFTQPNPTVFYTDSASAIDLGELFRVGKNSIHMTMRLNFIHECIQNGTISLKYINTNLEVADVLTNLLPVSAHELHTQ